MKKAILITLMLCVVCQLKAQVIAGLDEVALLGTWKSANYSGVWENIGYSWPLNIEFNDNGNSFITVKSNRETEPRRLVFNGYWLGGTATGRCTLHFICQREYDSNDFGLSMVNYVVKSFDGETLIIETYDGNGIAEFTKDNSSIENVKADLPEASDMFYNLNGVSVKCPSAPGLYIKGDGTKVVK